MAPMSDATLMRFIKNSPEFFNDSAHTAGKSGKVLHETVLPDETPVFLRNFCQRLRNHFELPNLDEAHTSIHNDKDAAKLKQLYATYEYVNTFGFTTAYAWLPFFRRAFDETVAELDQHLSPQMSRRSFLGAMAGGAAISVTPAETDMIVGGAVGATFIVTVKDFADSIARARNSRIPAALRPHAPHESVQGNGTSEEKALGCMGMIAYELLAHTQTHQTGKIRSLRVAVSNLKEEFSRLKDQIINGPER